ncbi:MAG: hypothetical protein ACR2KC_03815 [Acidimicrobiales bacterium]
MTAVVMVFVVVVDGTVELVVVVDGTSELVVVVDGTVVVVLLVVVVTAVMDTVAWAVTDAVVLLGSTPGRGHRVGLAVPTFADERPGVGTRRRGRPRCQGRADQGPARRAGPGRQVTVDVVDKRGDLDREAR